MSQNKRVKMKNLKIKIVFSILIFLVVVMFFVSYFLYQEIKFLNNELHLYYSGFEECMVGWGVCQEKNYNVSTSYATSIEEVLVALGS